MKGNLVYLTTRSVEEVDFAWIAVNLYDTVLRNRSRVICSSGHFCALLQLGNANGQFFGSVAAVYVYVFVPLCATKREGYDRRFAFIVVIHGGME